MTEPFFKYLQYEKRVSSHTLLAYQNDLEQFSSFIQTTFPDYKPEQADYDIVRAWIIQLVESGIEATSVNRKIACLRTFYKFLMRQEVISKDPMLKIKVLKTKKRLPSFVKEAEMSKMLEQEFEDTLPGWRDKLILELFYATGIRLSELIQLKESHIDVPDRIIKVLGKRNKERVNYYFNLSIDYIIRDYADIDRCAP